MIPPEIAFARFLHERHAHGEEKYAHIVGRIAVEDLPPGHLYRWFVDWMNHQLSDIGVNSTGGVSDSRSLAMPSIPQQIGTEICDR
jgi:hypothetical protein